ncbi:PEPxxWA-CTERM sorting domain-containing protein [Sphingomonas changnyeongensis]|uniref:PEPxxWA-CTERM sorting domain-containing protein n=1 Tax=Sphingomonas changnyeongensis TaxID=2698679 RepID=A0A7Z2NXN1_9SPHN|nr:PEPxxWA-CTERM sorting domain-containing protein [Sphingomonas changnyeongensis]QHL91686.1 PEPxxWA-CTERM sorting domain-containing protein [Sphingomonas changnyeongensis]
MFNRIAFPVRATLLAGALVLPALTAPAAAVVVLTGAGSYAQDFDTLASTGDSNTLPAGWALAETLTNANNRYTASTGSANAGDTYSFGATGSTERALGGLRSGSLAPLFGVVVSNETGRTITGFDLGFVGEQWRLGTLGRVDRLTVQYSLNATTLTDGNWIDIAALTFTAPVTAGTVGALNGNAAANRVALSHTLDGLSLAAGGPNISFRFVDFDATGADDGLAIDDFTLAARFADTQAPIPEPTTWAMFIAGMGVTGTAARRRRRVRVLA